MDLETQVLRLRHTTAAAQMEAVRSLGRFGGEAVKPLQFVVSSDSSAEVREEAAFALFRMTISGMPSPLEVPMTRGSATLVVLRDAARYRSKGDSEAWAVSRLLASSQTPARIAVVQLLDRLRTLDPSPEQRHVLLRSICDALQDGDRSVRQAALACIHRDPEPALATPLLAALRATFDRRAARSRPWLMGGAAGAGTVWLGALMMGQGGIAAATAGLGLLFLYVSRLTTEAEGGRVAARTEILKALGAVGTADPTTLRQVAPDLDGLCGRWSGASDEERRLARTLAAASLAQSRVEALPIVANAPAQDLSTLPQPASPPAPASESLPRPA